MDRECMSEALAGADALVLRLDYPRAQFVIEGHSTRLSLPSLGSLSAFEALCAPVDQPKLSVLAREGRSDIRLRLIDPHKIVRFVRLVGTHKAGVWQGLILPAGTGPGAGLERVEAEHALHQGLKDGEMTAFYQPLIRLSDESLAGFEALARWYHPDQGLLGPDDFFALAKDLGLLGQMGDAVRARALKDMAAWTASGHESLYLAVNVSGWELTQPGFAEQVSALVAEAGLKRGQIKVEITETEVMKHADAAMGAIATLRRHGVLVLLDDFGTGYSSLARLSRFGVDGLKIDQYFIRAMASDEGARTIVQSVLTLAQDMGLSVVAEGVEERESALRLSDMGCTYAQGFYYDGALNPEAASIVLSAGRAGRYLAHQA